MDRLKYVTNETITLIKKYANNDNLIIKRKYTIEDI